MSLDELSPCARLTHIGFLDHSSSMWLEHSRSFRCWIPLEPAHTLPFILNQRLRTYKWFYTSLFRKCSWHRPIDWVPKLNKKEVHWRSTRHSLPRPTTCRCKIALFPHSWKLLALLLLQRTHPSTTPPTLFWPSKACTLKDSYTCERQMHMMKTKIFTNKSCLIFSLKCLPWTLDM